jgi:cytosine/adenosine deaminase-related metal-dependent hydrolase
METVHDTDVVFESVAESGLRATIGKCMMDFDAQVPQRLQEETRRSIDESVAIRERWHGAPNGRLQRRLRAALRRFLLARAARGGRAPFGAASALVHTHASESRDEIAIVQERPGAHQHRIPVGVHLASPHSVRRALRLGGRRRSAAAGRSRHQGDALPRIEPEARIGHRPVPEMRRAASPCRSAPTARACNNRLDMFEEMRLAAVLQAMRRQPGSCPRATCCGWRRGPAPARSGSRRHRIARGRQEGRRDRGRSRSAAPGART